MKLLPIIIQVQIEEIVVPQDNRSIKVKVVGGLAWSYIERLLSQGVSLIVSIILARLLEPSDYGIIAIVMVFIAICNVFIENGLGVSLVQHKEANELDFSTVFYISFAISAILCVVMLLSAPLIGKFYEMSEIVIVIRILSIRLPIAGVNSIQRAYISRNMLFKQSCLVSLVSVVVSAIVGIMMAYKGFGIWALVGQTLTNSLTNTIVQFAIVKWRPKLIFSFSKAKEHFKYSWKITVGELLTQIYVQFSTILIGKYYTTNDLAFYNRGQTLADYVVDNINSSISSVLFPAISNNSDNLIVVKQMTRRAIRVSSYIISPMMLGLAVISEPLILLLLTEKWLPCVPFLRIVCVIYLFMPINASNIQAIKAVGRSDLFLKMEMLKKAIGLPIIFCALPFGVMVFAYSGILSSLATCIINIIPNKKVLGYGYKEQFMDIIPSIGVSLIMCLSIYFIPNIRLGNTITLIVQIIVGITVYFGLSWLLRMEQLFYTLDIVGAYIKRYIKNKKT